MGTMTTETEPEPTSSRQMRCQRRLYVMTDESGATWLAAENPEPEPSPVEGGSMSHRSALSDRGGSMSHRTLVPGDAAEVEGDDPDQVTIVVTMESGDEPVRLQAYRVSGALLPSGEDPAAS